MDALALGVNKFWSTIRWLHYSQLHEDPDRFFYRGAAPYLDVSVRGRDIQGQPGVIHIKTSPRQQWRLEATGRSRQRKVGATQAKQSHPEDGWGMSIENVAPV
jgi:hypothetical protein